MQFFVFHDDYDKNAQRPIQDSSSEGGWLALNIFEPRPSNSYKCGERPSLKSFLAFLEKSRESLHLR